MDYDDYGNQTVVGDLGLDNPAYDDERVTTTTYAHGGNALSLWIVNQPDTISVTDENGAFVAKTVNFYDAGPFIGIQGQIQNRALLNRTIEHISTNQTIQATRTRFDPFGNIEEMRDPVGNIRRITYDPVFHTHPVTESMVVGGGSRTWSSKPNTTMDSAWSLFRGISTAKSQAIFTIASRVW
jgi:hypothetical protein